MELMLETSLGEDDMLDDRHPFPNSVHSEDGDDEEEEEEEGEEHMDDSGYGPSTATATSSEHDDEDEDEDDDGSLGNGQANGRKSRDEISNPSSSSSSFSRVGGGARRGSGSVTAGAGGVVKASGAKTSPASASSPASSPPTEGSTPAMTRRTTATAAMAGAKWAMGLPPKTIKKRKKRSACHAWTSETRAGEIVREFAQDRTSAVFYLFRRIASGGMGKHLRIMPVKRNPPKYSCFFEELGMIADPDGDSHYHVWAWPAPGTAASNFMSTYVGATELEGVELGGATSDEEDAGAAAPAVPKEKPKRGRKRKETHTSVNGGEQASNVSHAQAKPKKSARTENHVKEEPIDAALKSHPNGGDDSSEVELEIEYDDDDIDTSFLSSNGNHGIKYNPSKQQQQERRSDDAAAGTNEQRLATHSRGPTVMGTMNGHSMTTPSPLPPQPMVDERSNGYHLHNNGSASLQHPIGDDHLAHLYSDLAAAEHLSLDEVLEHPALFGPEGMGTSTALSSMGFGNPEELLHSFLLQELDLDSIAIEFSKRLTTRYNEPNNRAWSVYNGTWQGCHEVAVKVYHEEGAYQTECHNLWKCNHPNIVHAYGRIYAIPGRDIQGCIVLERSNLGDLHSWLIDNQKYLHDTSFVRHFLEIVKGVASAMAYLHSASPVLIHGDLKPSNILLFGNKFELTGTPHYCGLRAKLSDVGVSHTCAQTESSVRGREAAKTSLGLWQPPEQRSNPAAAHFAPGTDVFSFGLLLWAFWAKTVTVPQLKRHLPLSDNERPSIPKECPMPWASLIKRCWASDTRERISAKALLEELGRLHS